MPNIKLKMTKIDIDLLIKKFQDGTIKVFERDLLIKGLIDNYLKIGED